MYCPLWSDDNIVLAEQIHAGGDFRTIELMARVVVL
jgi:hypothetical protein